MEKTCLPENDAVECLLLFQKQLVLNVGNTGKCLYGFGSHISIHVKILNIKQFFLLFEKLEEDIFVILLFFTDLFTIFELITILIVIYGNHISLMTPSGGIQMICFPQNHNFIISICQKKGIKKEFELERHLNSTIQYFRQAKVMNQKGQ